MSIKATGTAHEVLVSRMSKSQTINNIDFWFSPNCSTDCALQNGFLNFTCKNRDLRLVLCRWVTFIHT